MDENQQQNWSDQSFSYNDPSDQTPDPQQMPEYHHIPQQTYPTTNSMAVASLTMGILSLVSIITGMSFVFGALGFLFALLARKEEPMCGQAKTGLVLSIVGLIAGIALIIYVVISTPFLDIMTNIFNENPEYLEENIDDYFDEHYFNEDYLEDDEFISQHWNTSFTNISLNL